MLLVVARQAAAQCPDGTAPPCAAARRAAVARAVPSPEARARRFILLPFTNVTRGAAQDWLVTGAPLMLGEALGQFQDLAVVTEERLTAARRRLGIRADSQPDATQLRRLAEETDGWTAVTGNVFATGPRLRISVRALDVPTGRVITQGERVIAIGADARVAFDSLTALLVAPTGVRGARADLAALTTQSADAYRAYVRGTELLRQSAFRRAQQAFAEAVALDSTFALAWARLAYSSVNGNVWTLIDPASPAMRAIEESARLGTRLPERQLEFIRAMQNYVSRGQMRRARATLDSLAATDRDDLDARELLAGIVLYDTGLDSAAGGVRMAASTEHAVQLAREVLDRDPGRRNVHAVLATGYALAGGWWIGLRLGMRGESGSFAAMMLRLMAQGPDAGFVPVLRDSLVLVPAAEFFRLPSAERARVRRLSADAGMEWVERWLRLGPQDAEAHLWASRLAELRDDAPRALRELAVAESLGVESALENLVQRRLALLVRAERLPAAAALADSLLRGGGLRRAAMDVGLDRGRGYGVAAFLLTRRWADAGALLSTIGPLRGGRPVCDAALAELSSSSEEVSGAALRALADSVAGNVMSVAGVPTLAPCLGSLVLLVNDSTAGRRRFAGAALLALADSLHRAGGNEAMAYRAAAWSWAVDTAQHAAVSARGWFAARSRALAFGRHLMPTSATVDGDSVILEFGLNAGAPPEPGETADSLEWSFRVDMSGRAANAAVTLDVTLGSAPAGARAAAGSLLARAQAMRVRKAEEWPPSAFSMTANRTTASLQASTDGFRVVARGPFVSDLRRLRPPMAAFSAQPCIAVSDGLCGRPVIPLVYR